MTSTTPPSLDQVTNVHDMVVVHRVFRRELRLLPDLVRAVAPGDTARAAVLTRHARLVLDGLHLHHTGEDELLWPLLLERAAPSGALIGRMEHQHHGVEELLDRLRPALARWEIEARPAVGDEVARTVEALHGALSEHLGEEEAHILPLASRFLTQQEWDRLGQHSLARMRKAELPTMCWMILEDASPEERAALLAAVPFAARVLLKTVFAGRYRRYVAAVRATA